MALREVGENQCSENGRFFFSFGEKARGNFAVKAFCARGDGKERVVRPGCQVDVIRVTLIKGVQSMIPKRSC